MFVVLGGVDRAQGSPLKLAFSGGGGLGLQIPTDDPAATIDVSNGFARFTQFGDQISWSNSMPVGMHGVDYDSFDVTATLSEADRILATVRFSGPFTVETTAWGYNQGFESSVTGSSSGVVTIAPGVDPGLIPPWLNGLTATVDGHASGESGSEVVLGLTIAPAQVPEPSSVLVFLAAAGFVGVRRLRRA